MRQPSSPRALGRWVIAAGLGLLIAAAERPAGTLGAPPPSPSPSPTQGPSPVVARVGGATITAADLERRMATVPPFQLRTFGATPAEMKRAFLERVMVREALLSQGGTDHGLDAREDVKERIRGVLRSSMLARLRAEATSESPIDEAEIRAYYDKNAAKFRSPERVALWVIATQKREEAAEVIAELRKDSSPKHWSELSRSKSVDPITAMRGGNLGFVAPDGTTPEPGLKVSHTVMEAAGKLKDAEISPDPVKDGDRWMVVWRKQTMKSVERPLELEAGSIKQMLLHAHTDAKIKGTIATLRKAHLTEHAPDLLELFDISPVGDLTPTRRPGALPGGKRNPSNPMPSPGSLR